MARALIWINRSPEATSPPAAERMAMVANPTAAEAARAIQRPRRRPRHGDRASLNRRALSSGSRGFWFNANPKPHAHVQMVSSWAEPV
jgi:hypothetical protein